MSRFLKPAILTVVLVAACFAHAGEPTLFGARGGLELAMEAALIWAPDADLIYVENDEEIGADGKSGRWGYLFFSESRGGARGYSIRDGEILEAADLDFELEAPPLAADWVDSGVALAAAAENAGRDYCRDQGGRLETMLLIRGAFHDKNPDASTWAVVYTADEGPALTVVVDASNGEVLRKWKG